MRSSRRSPVEFLYRILILLFPNEYRREYGAEMERLFRDRRRQIGKNPAALFVLWGRAFVDVCVHATAERIKVHGRRRASATRRAGTFSAWLERTRNWIVTLRISARTLAKNPGYTSVAVTTLALGIGAATAVFTLVDAVLIQPLPFPEPEELVFVRHTARGGEDRVSLSDGLYLLYRDQAPSVEGIALYDHVRMNFLAGNEPEQVEVQVVTPSFFHLFRSRPALGRTFVLEEELPGKDPVVVLSDGLWRGAFGSDPAVIGKTAELNGVTRRIVGVMPPDFGFPRRDARAWVPYVVDPTQDNLTNFFGAGILRMADGTSLESLNAELQVLLSRLEHIYPESGGAGFLVDVDIRSTSRPLKEDLVGDIDTTMWILLGTVGLVLLIACFNVANLLLVRAESRRRELAVRLAMGASRGEVVRLFLSESLLLAGIGGFLGLIIGAWALRISLYFIPAELPRATEIGMDARVLVFTTVLALGSCFLLALFPIVRYRTASLGNPITEGGTRGGTGGKKTQRVRHGLVVLQEAMALVLLVGAGLMFRSFLMLQQVDAGFRTEGILTARITVPSGQVEGWRETAEFFRQLQERLAAQPGVDAVSLGRRVPLSGSLGFSTVNLEGRPQEPGDDYIVAVFSPVAPGYLETMGIPLVEGRALRPGDAADEYRAVMVSESFARRWWPNTSPVGTRLNGGGMLSRDWWEVVGVVGDVHQTRLEADPQPTIYLPLTVGSRTEPFAMRSLDVVVRTAGAPYELLPVLRRELRQLNSGIPLANPRTMDEIFDAATAQSSFTMAMLGSSAGIALLLGLVGIYGVVSYLVSLRTREFGVRIALGATASAVKRMVVFQGLALAVSGIVFGLVAAGLLSSLMASLLYGVNARDPVTYVVMAAALILVALLATWFPAARAASVDPGQALRED
jgi:predicted permease